MAYFQNWSCIHLSYALIYNVKYLFKFKKLNIVILNLVRDVNLICSFVNESSFFFIININSNILSFYTSSLCSIFYYKCVRFYKKSDAIKKIPPYQLTLSRWRCTQHGDFIQYTTNTNIQYDYWLARSSTCRLYYLAFD